MIRTLKTVDDKVLAEIVEEKRIRRTTEVFLLFSLGSQFDHLIYMMMARLGVFCLVADPASVTAEDVKKVAPVGIILSGGPVSVYKDPPPFDQKIFDIGIPVLGICLGFQLWAQHIGCRVKKSNEREFGVHELSISGMTQFFIDCTGKGMPVLESHGDIIEALKDPEFKILGHTKHAPVAVAQYKHLWGVQFHPEVSDTTYGKQMFFNFCFRVCKAKDRFPAKDIAQQKIIDLQKQIGDDKVLLALSGGSDSSTVAHLLRCAMVEKYHQLRAIYIKGIDRPDDEAHVLKYFGRQKWLDLRIIDATKRFLDALVGITDPREKRVAMRKVYKAVLEKETQKFGALYIAQGTLYTDISESGLGYDAGVEKAQIKLHHNVGLGFSEPYVELLPLSDQVKDTGRDIGRAVEVPEDLLVRHPFPGPGLIIRISGQVTPEKLRIARQLDGILIKEMREAGLYKKVWQAGVRLTEEATTCTKGDGAATGLVVILWAESSVNGFTSRPCKLPDDFWDLVDQRMTDEVPEVGCTCIRRTGKPPATIEFE